MRLRHYMFSGLFGYGVIGILNSRNFELRFFACAKIKPELYAKLLIWGFDQWFGSCHSWPFLVVCSRAVSSSVSFCLWVGIPVLFFFQCARLVSGILFAWRSVTFWAAVFLDFGCFVFVVTAIGSCRCACQLCCFLAILTWSLPRNCSWSRAFLFRTSHPRCSFVIAQWYVGLFEPHVDASGHLLLETGSH